MGDLVTADPGRVRTIHEAIRGVEVALDIPGQGHGRGQGRLPIQMNIPTIAILTIVVLVDPGVAGESKWESLCGI